MFFKTKEVKEYEFTCMRCGNIWYATEKDIRESKQLKMQIQAAKIDDCKIQSVKSHTANRAKIAQLQAAYNDPFKCPNCGSISVEKK